MLSFLLVQTFSRSDSKYFSPQTWMHYFCKGLALVHRGGNVEVRECPEIRKALLQQGGEKRGGGLFMELGAEKSRSGIAPRRRNRCYGREGGWGRGRGSFREASVRPEMGGDKEVRECLEAQKGLLW